ncbi:hypothetical protein ACSSS7_004125 [Eimeria intestinalis]
MLPAAAAVAAAATCYLLLRLLVLLLLAAAVNVCCCCLVLREDEECLQLGDRGDIVLLQKGGDHGLDFLQAYNRRRPLQQRRCGVLTPQTSPNFSAENPAAGEFLEILPSEPKTNKHTCLAAAAANSRSSKQLQQTAAADSSCSKQLQQAAAASSRSKQQRQTAAAASSSSEQQQQTATARSSSKHQQQAAASAAVLDGAAKRRHITPRSAPLRVCGG